MSAQLVLTPLPVSHKLLEWAIGTFGLGSPDPHFGEDRLWNGVCCCFENMHLFWNVESQVGDP